MQTWSGGGKGFQRPEDKDFAKLKGSSCEKCFQMGSGRAENRVVPVGEGGGWIE
jgi:hypothetical protein